MWARRSSHATPRATSDTTPPRQVFEMAAFSHAFDPTDAMRRGAAPSEAAPSSPLHLPQFCELGEGSRLDTASDVRSRGYPPAVAVMLTPTGIWRWSNMPLPLSVVPVTLPEKSPLTPSNT